MRVREKVALEVRGELFLSSLAAFIFRGLGAVSAFVMSLVAARFLAVDESGLFFLALAVVSFLATVGMLGLNQSVLRFVGGHHAEDDWLTVNAVVKQGVLWAGVSLVLLSVALFLAAPWAAERLFSKQALGPVLRAFSPGVVFVGLSMLVAHQLQAIRRTTQSIVVLSIAIPLSVGLSLVLLGDASARAVAGLYSLVAALTLGLALFWWRSNQPTAVAGGFEARVLWASCFPLWIVTIMNQAVQWSGQFIAGAWVPVDELAYLAVAQRTAMLVSFILLAVNLVVAPRFAALYKQSRHEELQRLALQATRLMVLFALPVVAFLVFFPELVMGLFGEAYREGAILLAIMAIGQFVNVVTGSVGYLLTMSGHERDMRNVVLVSGPVAVGCALMLTPVFGVKGAAIGTAVAVASQNLAAVFMVRKRLGFNTLAIWRRRLST